MSARTFVTTLLALVGFAGNSLLCRLALADRAIDPATFPALRLASGCLVLSVVACPSLRALLTCGQRGAALALFTYAALFSYAYVRLSTATGALLLFGAVQAVMFAWSGCKGERHDPRSWLGLLLAPCGPSHPVSAWP